VILPHNIKSQTAVNNKVIKFYDHYIKIHINSDLLLNG